MRGIILSLYVSLDGFMADPAGDIGWTAPFFDDEIARYARDELFGADALLLGRATYEGFAGFWPAATDATGLADRMNSMPKFVASTTLAGVGWNAMLLGGMSRGRSPR